MSSGQDSMDKEVKKPEEIPQFMCSPCQWKKRLVVAEQLCEECCKYLCTSCAESHNSLFEDTHLLVGKERFAQVSLTSLPSTRCSLHKGEIIKLWCRNHNRVVCSTCVAVHHRTCTEVSYIPAIVKEMLKVEEVAQLQEGLHQIILNLRELQASKHGMMGKIFDEKAMLLEKISHNRETLIGLVDATVEVDKETVEKNHKQLVKKVEDEVQECVQAARVAEEHLTNAKVTTMGESQLFVTLKKGQEYLSVAGGLAEKIRNQSNSLLKTELGTSRLIQYIKCNGYVKVSGKRFVVKTCKEIHIKLPNDQATCYISGTCMLHDGYLLIADVSNNKIKQVDTVNCKLKNFCKVSAGPLSICQISEHDIAAGLNNRSIQFLHYDGMKLTPTKNIELDHKCWGIAYSQKELFVTDSENWMYVYNIEGELLRQIGKNASGEEMFSNTRHVEIGSDENRIYIADMSKGVVCIDRHGRELARFTDTGLPEVYGLTTDDEGGLMLCGVSSGKVVRISQDGEKLGVVVEQRDTGMSTWSVCYDHFTHKLYVSTFSNCISMFELL